MAHPTLLVAASICALPVATAFPQTSESVGANDTTKRKVIWKQVREEGIVGTFARRATSRFPD